MPQQIGVPHLATHLSLWLRWVQIRAKHEPLSSRTRTVSYTAGMKTKIIVRFFLIVIFGALFGSITQHTHEKWHSLGREAYLTHESEWFDKKMATPSSAAVQVVEWILIACFVGGAYEGAAHFGGVLFTRRPPSQSS